MIIQIRGTSGSGKSTVMRHVMNVIRWKPAYVEGRKRPLYYESATSRFPRSVVLGHYEAQCGGCDTIGSARAVYELIQRIRGIDRLSAADSVILCEGILLSEDVKWSSQLLDLRVIYLTTPLAQCLKQIEGRRKDVGNDKPLNVENTTRRVAVIERSRMKLLSLGVECRRFQASQAARVILSWIKSTSQRGTP